MSKTLLVPTFFATACLVTASLAAQAPSTSAPNAPVPSTSAPTTSTQTASPSADKKITLSGCIERQAGTALSAAVGPASFTLTNAGAVAPAAAVGTAGAPTAGAPAASAKTYRLDAAESVIAPHVGHKVEVTGTVDDQPSAAASASAGASASASATMNAPKLKIDSVKMVAPTCQ